MYYELGNGLRGYIGGDFETDDDAWTALAARFDKALPSASGRDAELRMTVRTGTTPGTPERFRPVLCAPTHRGADCVYCRGDGFYLMRDDGRDMSPMPSWWPGPPPPRGERRATFISATLARKAPTESPKGD